MSPAKKGHDSPGKVERSKSRAKTKSAKVFILAIKCGILRVRTYDLLTVV